MDVEAALWYLEVLPMVDEKLRGFRLKVWPSGFPSDGTRGGVCVCVCV